MKNTTSAAAISSNFERREPCQGQPRFVIRDIAGKRLDVIVSDSGTCITLYPDPSYTGAFTFHAEDVRALCAEVLLETE